MKALIAYLSRVCAWLSQGINCVLLGGHHDQTVSARAYVHRTDPTWGAVYLIINRIFFWQKDHCRQSFLGDIQFSRQITSIPDV